MNKFFLLLFYLNICALAQLNAQTITISGSKLSFDDLSAAIKKQTGYLLFSKKGELKDLPDISVSNMPLKEFMDLLVKDRPLEYSISNKTIVLSPKPVAPATPESEQQVKVLIKFHISDMEGHVLPGASVAARKSKVSGMTGFDGTISLTVMENDVVVVSYIGFETKTVQLEKGMVKNGVVAVVLGTAESRLTEVTVVSTGYQTIERERSTGSVATVTEAELRKRNTVNILENLEGVVPGLVRFRGNLTIRGVSTLQANTNILVVVDGLPIEGSIADVNPYDVESISVLKDAAAAAIYGARASNGVIVVTTKRARAKGKTTVEVSSNFTISNKPDYSYYNYMTPSQQVDWESRYFNWWFNGGGGTVSNPIADFESALSQGRAISPVQYGYYQLQKGQITQPQLEALLATYRGNDFASEFREKALENQFIQQYNLAVRTNSARSQNSLVVNYTTDNMGIINAYNRQINIFLKGTYSLAKWLDVDYGVNSIIGKIRTHNNKLATNPFNVPSYYGLQNPDGTNTYYNTSQFNAYNTVTETTTTLYSAKFNHLEELGRDYIDSSVLNTRYYVNLNFKILPGLTINPMIQYEDMRRDKSGYSEAESYTMRWLQDVYTTRAGTPGNYTYTNLLPKGGKLATSNVKSPNYTARIQANFNHKFDKHGINAIAGAEFRQTRVYGQTGILLGYDDQLQTQATGSVNFGDLYAINTGTFWNPNYAVRQYHYPEISSMGLVLDEMHRFASGYANLTYTYDRKYSVFGSARKDYADLFGGDEKFRGKPLWSVGAAWVASNESFLQGIESINYLKLRASYGLTGNIRNVTARLAASTSTNPVTQLPNASVANPPNPQLRWEKTATTNIGVDFGLFDSRLKGAIDWYMRKGTDLFALKRLDPSEGFTSMTFNNASMRNNGVELNLGYEWFRPASASGFRWSSNLTAASNKNEITEVDELTRNPLTLAGGGAYRVGYPVRSVFSFRFAGLTDKGIAQWYDVKGTPTTLALGPNDADAIVFSGNADPKNTLALNNDFSYKGISLSVFAVYYGGHFYRARPVPVPYQSTNYASLPSYLLDSWTPSKTDTDIPGSGEYYQIPITNQYYYSDNLVRAADFIKIRNVVLGYDIPTNVASKIKATNLRLRFQVNNPKSIWEKQKDVHVDPETGGLPIPTSFVFGLNANF
jgi:TonB-linked SusC/RagA family outer membrane protein